MLETLEAPVLDDTDDDDIEHYFCGCSENIALCGEDITGDEIDWEGEPSDNDCEKCLAIIKASIPCVLCGKG